MLAFTSRGIVNFSEFAGRMLKSKNITLILIVLITLSGAYMQLARGNDIIISKVSSYQPVRDAGLWIKSVSGPSDVVISESVPQTAYYSERSVYSSSSVASDKNSFSEYINSSRPRYLIVSVFENHPQWIFEFVQENQARLVPVQGYLSDPNNPQSVLLVVYEIKYS
jgi:hypothetical protein